MSFIYQAIIFDFEKRTEKVISILKPLKPTSLADSVENIFYFKRKTFNVYVCTCI
jgi:hypothetical protein